MSFQFLLCRVSREFISITCLFCSIYEQCFVRKFAKAAKSLFLVWLLKLFFTFICKLCDDPAISSLPLFQDFIHIHIQLLQPMPFLLHAMYRHFSLSQLIPFSNPAIMSFHLHCFQIAVFALKWIFPMEQIPINGVRTWKINQQAQKNGILCNPFLQLGTGCFYSLLPD